MELSPRSLSRVHGRPSSRRWASLTEPPPFLRKDPLAPVFDVANMPEQYNSTGPGLHAGTTFKVFLVPRVGAPRWWRRLLPMPCSLLAFDLPTPGAWACRPGQTPNPYHDQMFGDPATWWWHPYHVSLSGSRAMAGRRAQNLLPRPIFDRLPPPPRSRSGNKMKSSVHLMHSIRPC
jgi:hypothetical protein